MKQWEKDYRQLLDQLRTANPDVKIALGTPFVAQVGRIGSQDNYQQRKALIAECATVVRRIASDYHATLLDYEKLFNELTAKMPPTGFGTVFTQRQQVIRRWPICG